MNQCMNRSGHLCEEFTVGAATSRCKESPSCMDGIFQMIRGERPINHVATVLKLSLGINILIVLTMTAVAIGSKSLALLSTLVENMVDLVVQCFLAYAGTCSGKRQNHAKFPAGTSRLEPVAVIVASSIMLIVSIVFIQEGCRKLVNGFVHRNPEKPHLSVEARNIGLSDHHQAVDAVRGDNRNDVVSNSFAITAYIIASVHEELWYVDAVGAIVIFLLIMIAWGRMGKEQIMQLVGVTASDEFITSVKELCRHHSTSMALDIVRAYHFGTKHLVELEVVVPGSMTVKDAHDIALQLQFKVEQLDDVERAFVHVDYTTREYDEHVVSREEDALLMYTRYGDGEAPRLSCMGGDDGVEVVVTPRDSLNDSLSYFEEMKLEKC